MKIVYMGSGSLACPALSLLVGESSHEVVGVVTQPDRPKGRNRRFQACPAKILAEELGLPVLAPEKIGARTAIAEITNLGPDLIVVAAYGQYISSELLCFPRHRAINIHPSLLPKYRGASPIQWAIANGEKVTGVTILYVSKELDAGDILNSRSEPIHEEDTAASLESRLAMIGAELLEATIGQIENGDVSARPQDARQATYVHKLKKEDGLVDWTMPAEQIHNRVRGFYPWPGCFSLWPRTSGSRLRILKTSVEDKKGHPAEVLDVNEAGPLIGSGSGSLRLLKVQPAGKKAMSGGAFLNGYKIQVGDIF